MKTAFSILAAALVVAFGVAPSVSSTIEIPLDQLEGGYEMDPSVAPNFDYPEQRSSDLVLPDGVTVIEAITLVISGEWHTGEIRCNQGGDIYVTYPLLPELLFFLTSDAFPDHYFLADLYEMPEGPFENLALEVTSCCPPGSVSLEELIGSELHVELVVSSLIIGICSLTVDPFGTLDEVHLEIIGTVPVAATTWGGVKSLYY